MPLHREGEGRVPGPGTRPHPRLHNDTRRCQREERAASQRHEHTERPLRATHPAKDVCTFGYSSQNLRCHRLHEETDRAVVILITEKDTGSEGDLPGPAGRGRH